VEDFVEAVFYCPHTLVDGNYSEKTPEFSVNGQVAAMYQLGIEQVQACTR